MSDRPRCHGTNKAGNPCKAAPAKGTDWCRAHDPNVPEEDRFGGREQSARAGGSPKPRVPKVMEALIAKVDERAEEIVEAVFEALAADRAVVVGTGEHAELELAADHPTRLRAVQELLDRVVGKPRQAVEVTGEDGGPLAITGHVDLTKLSTAELRQLRGLLERAGEAAPDG